MLVGALISRTFLERYREAMREAGEHAGLKVEPIVLEDPVGARVDPKHLADIQIAFLSSDLQRGNRTGFRSSIADAPNLRWLQIFGVGIDSDADGSLLVRGVRITNAVGVNAEPVSLSAIAGLLMLARRFPYYLELQKRHEWRPFDWNSSSAPSDLNRQTMVIVGLGAIGGRIAALAQALGLRVIGVRRTPPSGEEPVDEMVHPSNLDEVLPRADWLVLASLLTGETRRLIDARRLALLPAGAHLINVSRGAIVVEGALIESLERGHLGGAYLDVFEREPLLAESPLWDMKNVIVTPHNAAASNGKYEREARLFLDNLVRWGKGEPLINEVLQG
jgi:phosphoglycerate dehydrogenase-like enzyme